jgi:hypothetical protein
MRSVLGKLLGGVILKSLESWDEDYFEIWFIADSLSSVAHRRWLF